MKLNEIVGKKVWLVIHQRHGAPDLSVLGIFSTEAAANKRYDDFAEENDGEAPEYTYVTEVTMNVNMDMDLN